MGRIRSSCPACCPPSKSSMHSSSFLLEQPKPFPPFSPTLAYQGVNLYSKCDSTQYTYYVCGNDELPLKCTSTPYEIFLFSSEAFYGPKSSICQEEDVPDCGNSEDIVVINVPSSYDISTTWESEHVNGSRGKNSQSNIR